MRPLKILFVSSMILSPEKPVLNPVIEQQAEAIRKEGHSVDTLLIESYNNRFEYILLIYNVFMKTFVGDYDLVHAHYGLSAITTSFCWRTPVVLTLHGSDALVGTMQPIISRFYACFASATIAVSKQITDRISGCDYIPCGADINLFKPQDRSKAREHLGLQHDVRYILFPYSSLRQVKRYDIAKQVVKTLNDKGINTELIVVANQTSSKMVYYYNAADAMIMCSDSEGSPTAVKEALACDIPVISTDVGDLGAILSGIDEVEFCEQTPESLAAGFEQLFIENPKSRWQSRELMKRFSLQNNANQILQVYARVLKLD